MANVQIHGLKELRATLAELPAKLAAKALVQGMRKAFAPVLAAAKQMAPRDTGSLADSLRLTSRKGRDGVIRVGIRIGASKRGAGGADGVGKDTLPPARRWHFVELGTADLAPHPFLRPALDANKQAVLDALKVEILEAIKKVTKRKTR